MIHHPTFRRRIRHAAAAALAGLAFATPGMTGATAAKPVKPPAKAVRKAPPAPPEATSEQLEAAQLVYLGRYVCEFGQAIEVEANSRHQGYVDVRHGKAVYLMKPVLSSTGAVRLEDMKGDTLMVQIASKSMLMNVKAGRRLVDDCVSARQRELNEAAARAQAADAAASAASAPAAAASEAPVAASEPAPSR
ncbi:hypothetical protein [Piscinibacter sp. XHJ-5]|uniref:hypothetical protein n=1 Tax=Piscinibacter sp. XHJ-5 TaxID=3037797 RepID=UPI00245303A3|nr:hypothetical protein [Piscinibacter sp. XHJ-5]